MSNEGIIVEGGLPSEAPPQNQTASETHSTGLRTISLPPGLRGEELERFVLGGAKTVNQSISSSSAEQNGVAGATSAPINLSKTSSPEPISEGLLNRGGILRSPAHVVPAAGSRKDILGRLGLRSLQEIVDHKYLQTIPVVENLISPGETALLIARQKEGKSTLALQLAIDVACGDRFLGRYKTQRNTVLYVDYENRPHRIKERAKDLAKGRSLDDIISVSYNLISDRDVGLFGDEFKRLDEIVQTLSPGLLIIDPLRYAIQKESTDERAAVDALDQISLLRTRNPQTAVLLVHHLKKAQDNLTSVLRNDPRTWIERIYGSQAFLAHAENIWGLEHDDAGCAFGTVSRSEESLIIGLEKEADSLCFAVSANSVQVAGMTPALRAAWDLLPTEFSRGEGLGLRIANNTLDRLIRHAKPIGLLTQDASTGRYKKAS